MFQGQTLKWIEQHIAAIGLCLHSKLPGPSLILIYVGIDAFGTLGRPVGQGRRGRQDFVDWADRYMIKPKRLPVTAMELYGARCGLLHALGAESDLSVAGRVRPLLYAWGDRHVEPANAVIAEVAKLDPKLNAVMVKVEDIAEAFVQGMARFGQDVDADPALAAEVAARTRKMFGQFAQFPGTPEFERDLRAPND